MTFKDKLKKLRTDKPLTQAELAEKCNIATNTINRWENGANFPGYRNIVNLANALEIDATDFLDEDNQNETEQDEIKKAARLQNQLKEATEKAKKAYTRAYESDRTLKETPAETNRAKHNDAGDKALKDFIYLHETQHELLVLRSAIDFDAFQTDADFMMDLFRKLSPVGRDKVFRFVQNYLFLDNENITQEFIDATSPKEE